MAVKIGFIVRGFSMLEVADLRAMNIKKKWTRQVALGSLMLHNLFLEVG